MIVEIGTRGQENGKVVTDRSPVARAGPEVRSRQKKADFLKINIGLRLPPRPQMLAGTLARLTVLLLFTAAVLGGNTLFLM